MSLRHSVPLEVIPPNTIKVLELGIFTQEWPHLAFGISPFNLGMFHSLVPVEVNFCFCELKY